jgi:hypothetical protein
VYRTELFKKKLDPVSMTEIVNVPDMSGMCGQSIISSVITDITADLLAPLALCALTLKVYDVLGSRSQTDTNIGPVEAFKCITGLSLA